MTTATRSPDRRDTVRDLAVLFLFSLLVHGLLLLDHAPRWDGWLVYELLKTDNWPELRRWFAETGVLPTAYVHYWVGQFPDFLAAYKAVAFASLLAMAVSLYFLLCDLPSFGRADRLYLTMAFVSFPAYLVTVELILLPVLFYAAMFALAALSYREAARAAGPTRVVLRVVSLALFYFSFMLQSLLVFFAAFFVYAFARWHREQWPTRSTVMAFVRSHADFILLPFLYFAVKLIWFQPYGDFAGYNELRPSVGNLFKGTFRGVFGGYLAPLAGSIEMAADEVSLFLVCVAALLLTLQLATTVRNERTRLLLLVGLLLLGIGLAPYAVVGKAPTPGDWSSRSAIHVALGAAFVTYYGLRSYTSVARLPATVGTVALLVLLATFATVFIESYTAYGIDALKQQALSLRLRESPQVAAASTVVVEDSATQLNAHGRQFRYYEYTAMLQDVFGDQKRLGAPSEEYVDGRFIEPPIDSTPWRILLSNYDPSGPTVHLRLSSSYPKDGLRAAYFRSLYWRFRGGRARQLEELLRSLLTVSAVRVEPGAR